MNMNQNNFDKTLTIKRSWLVLILSALIPTVAIMLTFITAMLIKGDEQDVEFSIYSPAFAVGVLISHSLIFLILYKKLRKNKLDLKDIYWKLNSEQTWWKEIVFGLILGLILYLFKEFVIDSMSALVNGNQPTFHSLFNFNFNSAKWYPLIVTPLVFVEESVFRGFAYRTFKDRYSTAGILVFSSLLFGLMHIGNGLNAMIVTSIIGALYFSIFLNSKNLWRVYFVHLFYNTLIILTS
ncbi:MAG: membrane protein of unknown function [Promethearchaeota archaeon]|nr:MAG: membrane protein of unknown function [Candidatus Lokiarchaeota archaeon]